MCCDYAADDDDDGGGVGGGGCVGPSDQARVETD